jgi:hypothetical protein
MTQPTASRPVTIRHLRRPRPKARQRHPTETAPREPITRIAEPRRQCLWGFLRCLEVLQHQLDARHPVVFIDRQPKGRVN